MYAHLSKLSRLKGFFRSAINYSDYGRIIGNAERKVVGNLPDDLLGCIIRNNPNNKKEAILGTQSIFEETAIELSKINKLERQAIFRTTGSPRAYERQMYFLRKGDIKGALTDGLYKEKELETIIQAEDVLLKGFKKYLPETKNVVITPLGSGMFGNGYKCEVFGKDGQKLIRDKVIKLYRDEHLGITAGEKNQRWASIMPDEELLQFMRKRIEDFNKKNPHFQLPLPESAEKIREEMAANLKHLSEDKSTMEKFHGAAAEANISEYLRFISGHRVKPEDGIAIPSMFGLGNVKFAISEFIGKGSKAKREFDFGRLNLRHEDFKLNPGNGINGICIDMGGITVEHPEILSNKTAVRILKSLSQVPASNRVQVFEKIKTSMSPHEVSPDVLSKIEQLLVAA